MGHGTGFSRASEIVLKLDVKVQLVLSC